MLAGLLIVAVSVPVVLGGYLLAQARQPGTEPASEFRCPRCEQKVRCVGGPSGQRVLCPRCTRRPRGYAGTTATCYLVRRK